MNDTTRRDERNRTRQSTRRSVKAPRGAISLRTSDALVGRDFISELGGFLNTAASDDRYDGVLPTDVYQLLELFGMKAARSRSLAFAFCLQKGVELLLCLPGISIIRGCREAGVAAGSEDLDWFEHWRFDVAARSGRRRHWFRNIDPADVARCADVARELGLPTATLATLAAMAILFQVKDVPDDKKTDFLGEVRRFGHELKKRAGRAEQFRDRTRATPAPSLTFSFDDVLEDLKKKKKSEQSGMGVIGHLDTSDRADTSVAIRPLGSGSLQDQITVWTQWTHSRVDTRTHVCASLEVRTYAKEMAQQAGV